MFIDLEYMFSVFELTFKVFEYMFHAFEHKIVLRGKTFSSRRKKKNAEEKEIFLLSQTIIHNYFVLLQTEYENLKP